MGGKKGDGFIIFCLWLLVFAASSQIMIVSPILPRIAEQLHASEGMLGTLVTSYAVTVGFFALVVGPISDKVGRRRILLYGTAGLAVALALHGLATRFITLLLARCLAGVAGGILSGSAIAYIGDYFPYERRGWASGWVMSGVAAGQILGIPLGTVLAGEYGFRTPFLVFSVLMAFAFVFILKWVPQPDVERSKERLTLSHYFRKYGDLLKRPAIRATCSAFLLQFFSLSVFIVYLPTWLESHFSVGGTAIATLFFIGGLGNVLSGPNAGKLSDIFGRKGLILLSCIGFSIVMFASTFVIKAFWVAYPLFFLAMVLIAMRISPFQALATELVVPGNRGALMSFMTAMGQTGTGLGGAVAGAAYVSGGFVSNTMIGGGVILIVAFIVWRFVPEPRMKKVEKDQAA